VRPAQYPNTQIPFTLIIMNRTNLFLIVFVILGIIVGYLVFSRMPEKDNLSTLVADRKFAAEDIDEVHKIFIADRRGNQTLLTRQNGYWLYNDQYRARPNAIENLLDAVRRIQVKYKPPVAAVDNMIKDLSSQGIKVELYDKQDKVLKVYYIGGSTADERGTFAIMDGAEEPYVTHLPGWEGNLRFRYNLKGDDWKDKTLLAFQPEEIVSLSIEYPKQKNKSFRFFAEDGQYSIIPYFEVTPVINRPVNQASTEAYLIGFESIIAEAFENSNPIQDSILQKVPFSIIRVKDKDGLETELKLYPLIPRGVNIDPKTGIQQNAQIERFFVHYNGQDFMLAQNRILNKLLWAYEFFFE